MRRIKEDERFRFHRLLNQAMDKLNNPKNSKKKHWSELTIKELYYRLDVEVHELGVAINFEGKDDILSECDDIINFAMFIKDNLNENNM